MDQGKQNAVDILRHRAKAALHGGKLAETVVGIFGEDGALREPRGGPDSIGLRADHYNYRRADLRKYSDQPVEKRLTAKIQQRFRGSHALRLAGSQNQSGDVHFRSTRADSSAKIAIASERQSDFGLRRTAIISAATEIAISSREMAPISSPMGA